MASIEIRGSEVHPHIEEVAHQSCLLLASVVPIHHLLLPRPGPPASTTGLPPQSPAALPVHAGEPFPPLAHHDTATAPPAPLPALYHHDPPAV